MSKAIWTKQGETLSHKNACKEFGESRPYINLYIENGLGVSKEDIRTRINEEMKKLDSDYNDVHALLGHEPLKLTLLADGTFEKYQSLFNSRISRINPSGEEVTKLVTCSEGA